MCKRCTVCTEHVFNVSRCLLNLMNSAFELTNLHQLCSYFDNLLLKLAQAGMASVELIQACQQLAQAGAIHQPAPRRS